MVAGRRGRDDGLEIRAHDPRSRGAQELATLREFEDVVEAIYRGEHLLRGFDVLHRH